MTIDESITRVIELREEIAQLEKRQEELKHEKARVEASLMDTISALGTTGVKSLHGTATLMRKQKPFIADFEQFMAFVIESGHTQLLQKRLATKAYAELINADVEVPGTNVLEEFALSVTRA